MATFLLRELPQYGVRVPAAELRLLWMMCTHLHILEEAFVIRRLQPWFENIGKRQRKSPKLYIRDSGLLHALLGIRDEAGLRLHPSAGASWEGFILEQILAHLRPDEAWFWKT